MRLAGQAILHAEAVCLSGLAVVAGNLLAGTMSRLADLAMPLISHPRLSRDSFLFFPPSYTFSFQVFAIARARDAAQGDLLGRRWTVRGLDAGCSGPVGEAAQEWRG